MESIMLNRCQKLLTGGRLPLIAGLFLSMTAPVAQAQLIVYDDFATARIDESRWTGRQITTRTGGTGSLLEIQREVTNAQALVLQTRVVGGSGAEGGGYSVDNALAFRHSQALSEIMFDVVVRRAEAGSCSLGNATASARGVFPLFNDGLGDVVAIVGVSRSANAGTAPANLDVVASLVHRTDTEETSLGSMVLGSTTIGQRVRLRMRWDPANDRVRFRRDAEALVSIDYSNPEAAEPTRPRKYLSATSSVSDCAAGSSSAAVTAAFDDVRVR
jgi:hypothetical protein